VHAYTTCTLVEDIRELVLTCSSRVAPTPSTSSPRGTSACCAAVDDATHWLAEERPELVSAAIREHIERVGAAARV
jgi:hypothetical protein